MVKHFELFQTIIPFCKPILIEMQTKLETVEEQLQIKET
jgi:hypothetical protein